MLGPNMKDTVSALLDVLESQSLSDISKGLSRLERLLLGLVEDLRQFEHNGTICSDLDAFVKLQDNFGFNITSCIVKLYKRDLPKKDFLLLNRNLQGLLLLHPPSKSVFNRHANMSSFLSLLNRKDDKFLTITTITTLIHILLKNYGNYRAFESGNGCPIIIQHLSLTSVFDIDKETQQQQQQQNRTSPTHSKELDSLEQPLNFKIIEFLMLYMSEEVDNPNPHTVEMKADLFRDAFPLIDLLIESLSELDKL
ncbi:hypothetical protein I9W82_004989 [Candida metapsilosis]|uniref:Uncharacterized protein n=1 Tax=Candida metapsilosis TaxID=273372 RepID=A0A8H7ZCC4_9ASCO|nr:hypothetical protein I9W82_004989 [Candida metapsilosis]